MRFPTAPALAIGLSCSLALAGRAVADDDDDDGGAPAVRERARRVEWLAANVVPLRSIDAKDEDFSDLEPLVAKIGDAQVVALGEQSHGDGATFAAKARLIKFLHRRMGFDVLAWESGIYNCKKMEDALRAGEPIDQAMAKGIFGVWHSEQVRPVFEYARATHGSARPLEMCGFDCQLSAWATTKGLPLEVRAFFAKAGSAAIDADEGAALDATIASIGGRAPLAGDERRKARAGLERLLGRLREKRAELEGIHDATTVAWMERCLSGLLVFEELASASAALKSARDMKAMKDMWPIGNLRDRAMGENLVWLVDERYRGRKIIVWAATMHAVRNAPEIVLPEIEGFYREAKPMGHVAFEKLGRRLYTIGFTAHHGRVGNASMGGERALEEPDPASLEALLHAAKRPLAFLSFRDLPEGHWLRAPIGARPLGYAPTRADWSRVMDAMVFTDEMVPSERMRARRWF